MVDMTGSKLFRPRYPHTLGYEIEGKELDLYDAVTNFVSKELAEIRGQSSRSAAGFALTTMQRRLASSVRAIRRTLERRIERLERALADPEAYLRNRKDFQADVYDDPDASPTWTRTSCGNSRRRHSRSGCRTTVAELEAESRHFDRCSSKPRTPKRPEPNAS